MLSESMVFTCSLGIRKKDETFRFCVDYTKLNGVSVKDAYPLPRVDRTLH